MVHRLVIWRIEEDDNTGNTALPLFGMSARTVSPSLDYFNKRDANYETRAHSSEK